MKSQGLKALTNTCNMDFILKNSCGGCSYFGGQPALRPFIAILYFLTINCNSEAVFMLYLPCEKQTPKGLYLRPAFAS